MQQSHCCPEQKITISHREGICKDLESKLWRADRIDVKGAFRGVAPILMVEKLPTLRVRMAKILKLSLVKCCISGLNLKRAMFVCKLFRKTP